MFCGGIPRDHFCDGASRLGSDGHGQLSGMATPKPVRYFPDQLCCAGFWIRIRSHLELVEIERFWDTFNPDPTRTYIIDGDNGKHLHSLGNFRFKNAHVRCCFHMVNSFLSHFKLGLHGLRPRVHNNVAVPHAQLSQFPYKLFNYSFHINFLITVSI